MNTETVFALVVEFVAKSVAIVLLALLLARTWRSATAAQRHLVGLVALVTVAMLPLTRLVSPRWAIPMRPAQKVKLAVTPWPPVLVESAETESRPAELPALSPASAPTDWRKLVLGFWLSGAILLLGHRLTGSWRLQRLKHRSAPLDDARVRILLSRTLKELGIRRRPEVRFSQECRVPMTWGSIWPVMLLPAEALEWNDTWLTAALRHETAHIRRHDYLTRWIAQIAGAFYWPNPFVWLLARYLRVAQEQAADDLVLRAGTPAEEYATQLVDAARTVALHGFFVRQAVAMACPSTLEHRIRAIVDGRRDRRPLGWLAVGLGSTIIALALAISTVAQLRGEDKPQTPEAPGAPTPAKSEPQIEIEAKFVEIEPEAFQGTDEPEPQQTVYSDPEFQVVIRGLNQKEGVNLLSAPRVTTRANQRATIEALEGFRYPTQWEENTGNPKAFATRKVGTTLEVTPEVNADGSVALRLKQKVVEFLGFHGTEPAFSEGQADVAVALKSGETVAVSGIKEVCHVKSFEKITPARKLIVFVTARIIKPETAGTPAKGTSENETASTTPPLADATEKAAARIIIPSIEFREAPLAECVAFLQQKSRELSAGEPAVNVILEAPPGMETPVITLSLKNGSLLEGVRYVAALADLVVKSRQGALVIAGKPVPVPAKNPLGLGAAKAAPPPAPAGQFKAGAKTGAEDSPNQPANGLLTKEWKIPADLIPSAPGAGDGVRESAKEWLISKGIKFEGGASAVYIVATSRLIVRNTSDQLDRVDQIMSAGTQGPATAKNEEHAAAGTVAAAPESPVLTKAKRIIIPRIELREASITEALDFLRIKAAELDPDKTGVNIVLKPGSPADPKITMSLTNIPLAEALRYVAGLSNLELRFDPAAVVLSPAAPASPSETTIEITSDTVTVDEKTGATEFSGDTHLKIVRPGEAPLVIEADKLKLRGIAKPAQAGTERGTAEGEGQSDPTIPPDSVTEAKGIPVSGKPGYITSPFAPKAGMIDVRPFPAGTKLKCPYTAKVIIVP